MKKLLILLIFQTGWAQPGILKDGRGTSLEIERNPAQVFLTMTTAKGEFRNAILSRYQVKPILAALKKAHTDQLQPHAKDIVHYEYTQPLLKIQIRDLGGRFAFGLQNSVVEPPLYLVLSEPDFQRLAVMLRNASSGKWDYSRKQNPLPINVMTRKPAEHKYTPAEVNQHFP
jgi:hypothetical protein